MHSLSNLTNDAIDNAIASTIDKAQLDALFAERSRRIAARQAEIAQAEADWLAELDAEIAQAAKADAELQACEDRQHDIRREIARIQQDIADFHADPDTLLPSVFLSSADISDAYDDLQALKDALAASRSEWWSIKRQIG